MNYQIFREFDAYEAAFQHAQVCMTLHRRQRQSWALGHMSLGKLHLQWGTSGGSMVSEGEVQPGGQALFVPLTHLTTNAVNGCRLSDDTVMVASSGAEFCVSADSWNHWFSLFVRDDVIGNQTPFVEQGTSGCRTVKLGRRRISDVRGLVQQLIQDASRGALSQAAYASAGTVLEKFAQDACEKQSKFNKRRGRPRIQRDGVVRLIKEDLQAAATGEFRVSDLANSTNVSERTLLRIFRNWYGTSPSRYVQLRKIHTVRDALLAASPRATTVTDVLARNNINQFGRFAGVYHSLFGEYPSETLNRNSL